MLCSSSLVIICRFMVLAETIGSAGDEASVRLFFRTLGGASVCNPLAVVFCCWLYSVCLRMVRNDLLKRTEIRCYVRPRL